MGTNKKISTATISFPGKTFVDADLNTGSFTITGTIKWPVGGSSSCSTTFSVVRKPFFNVTNGDLMVGGVYPTGSPLSCRTTSSGNLSSWANASNTLRQGAHVDLVALGSGNVVDSCTAAETFFVLNDATATRLNKPTSRIFLT